MNVFEAIRARNEGRCDKAAVIEGGTATSYGDLMAAAKSVAAALREAGVRRLARVALVCDNCADHIVVSLGILAAEATVVPVAPEHAPAEIAAILADMDVEFAVFRAGMLADDGAAPFSPRGLRNGDFRLAKRAIRGVSPPRYAEIAPAFIRFSSGTTGRSKGVILSHATIVERTDAANEGLAIVPEDNVLWVLSMSFHFVVTILLFLRKGATIVLCGGRLIEGLADGLENHRISVIYASPFHYSLMGGSDLFRREWFATLRLAVSTAVQLPGEIARSFLARSGVPLTEAYGIIEVGLPFVSATGAGSLGKPLPGYAVRIAGQDADGVGEVLLRGKGMLDAYLSPWRTRAEILEDGWFRTGDLGRLDPDGALAIVGRKKDVINFTGMKVFPMEVEAVLNSHPGVKESQVYGEDHPQYGQLPVARVVASGVDADSLRRHCYERLAAYKVPKAIEFVSEIPKTASGKVRRH